VERIYSSYSSSTSALDGVSGQFYALAALYNRGKTSGTHCTRGWVGLRAGLDTEARREIISPLSGIEPRSPGLPTRSQTLYWLSYPAYLSLSVLIYKWQITIVYAQILILLKCAQIKLLYSYILFYNFPCSSLYLTRFAVESYVITMRGTYT
jgi:hypothetical protein